jgi:hypothetical protein
LRLGLEQIMKMFDEVAVVCDHRTVESALALRGVLEHFRLRVRFHRLVEHREALDFFAGHAPPCPYTVLMSMATTGEEAPGSGILDVFEDGLRFEVFETAYGDPDAEEVVDRSKAFFDLTPRTIANLVTAAGGTLIAIAGQESLVQPFLAAGYDAVIAPIEPPERDRWLTSFYYTPGCPDYDAALLFTIGFFYFAMSEDAVAPVRAGGVDNDEQAVAQASAALGSAHRDHTGGYRYHRRAA